jgi:predicted RNA-binding Zn-ribbon protein involved in translation (DUF1610 family)
MKVKQVERVAECPACGAQVEFPSGARKGSEFGCPACGERLVVMSMNPPELDYGLNYEDWRDREV